LIKNSSVQAQRKYTIKIYLILHPKNFSQILPMSKYSITKIIVIVMQILNQLQKIQIDNLINFSIWVKNDVINNYIFWIFLTNFSFFNILFLNICPGRLFLLLHLSLFSCGDHGLNVWFSYLNSLMWRLSIIIFCFCNQYLI
jgi:hypothetical protein